MDSQRSLDVIWSKSYQYGEGKVYLQVVRKAVLVDSLLRITPVEPEYEDKDIYNGSIGGLIDSTEIPISCKGCIR